MKFDVVALGELLIDFTCSSVDSGGYPTIVAHPGGAPANFLSAIQKFGGKTALIGKVGSDVFGKLLIHTLDQLNIDRTGITVTNSVFTTLSFVTLTPSHDREFSFSRKPGADTCLEVSEIDTSLIDDAKVFHFGTISLTDNPVAEATKFAVSYARQKGKIISFDPNLRKPLWDNLDRARQQMVWGLKHSDIVKISDEEVVFLFGDISYEEASRKMLYEFGVKLVYITLGKQGCLYANKHAVGQIPALAEIPVVDTTGAGDIFGGSAMWGVLQTGKHPDELSKDELDQIVGFACASASLSTTRMGGLSSTPEFSDVMKVLGQV